MRSTTIVSLLVATWALLSREETASLCKWTELTLFNWNQNRLLPMLLQSGLKLTRPGKGNVYSLGAELKRFVPTSLNLGFIRLTYFWLAPQQQHQDYVPTLNLR
jgi:hypothetical protein